MPQFHSTAERLKESDDVEVGAINCERPGNKQICSDWLSVDAYPSLLLLNRRHGTLARYPSADSKAAEEVARWALATAREWRLLFTTTANVAHLDAEGFGERVLDDARRAWVVLFSDGLACAPCRTARTNLLRLSASLAGLPVGLGIVDCEEPSNGAFCREEHGMPERPHGPAFLAWPRGLKRRGGSTRGEALFSAEQIEPHRALELIDRGLRLALANERASSGGEEGGEATAFERHAAPPGESGEGGADVFGGGGPPGGFRWDGPQRDPDAKPLPWGGPRRPDAAPRIGR